MTWWVQHGENKEACRRFDDCAIVTNDSLVRSVQHWLDQVDGYAESLVIAER